MVWWCIRLTSAGLVKLIDTRAAYIIFIIHAGGRRGEMADIRIHFNIHAGGGGGKRIICVFYLNSGVVHEHLEILLGGGGVVGGGVWPCGVFGLPQWVWSGSSTREPRIMYL